MSNQADQYTSLKEIVNKADPIGLVDPDTPESLNEYDAELKEILKEDVSLLDKERLSQRIYNVFVQFFNEEIAGPREKYDSIADQFLAKKEK